MTLNPDVSKSAGNKILLKTSTYEFIYKLRVSNVYINTYVSKFHTHI